MRKTNEGSLQYEHSLDHAVEFFSKAGSLFTKKESFYGNEESALGLFQKTWIVDPITSFKLLLWLRDCRGGAGNRSGSREIYKWLATEDPEWLGVNIGWLPLVGRWDDLRSLFTTPVEKVATKLWAEALKKKDVLAAKWADRTDAPLKNYFEFSEATLRKFLSRIRKNHIVEHKMCQNEWDKIQYKTVPSVAMARYTKAFGRHDEERFDAYKEALETGKETIHSGVLFPHDCVRTVKHGDAAIADAQFEHLPNYMAQDERVIVLCDTSRSMCTEVAGKIQAVDISQALALYCSFMIPEGNPFHKKFIGFESEGRFVDWDGLRFSQAIKNGKIFDGACGSTQVDKALDTMLTYMQKNMMTKKNQVTTLLIVSDMQFSSACRGVKVRGSYYPAPEVDGTEVEKGIRRWVEAGFNAPKVIYWNVAGYAGAPTTVKSKNVALVSGFSPAILQAVFAAEDLTPRGVMLIALMKYKIDVPK